MLLTAISCSTEPGVKRHKFCSLIDHGSPVYFFPPSGITEASIWKPPSTWISEKRQAESRLPTNPPPVLTCNRHEI